MLAHAMSLRTPIALPGDVLAAVMSQVLECAPTGFAVTMSDGSIVLAAHERPSPAPPS
jgi:hypothetical protein